MKIRLNKYLALCGLGSRRKVEELISARRIRINDEIVPGPGVLVDTDSDEVCLDEKPLSPRRQFQYIILNKPKGYITTLADDRDRPIVMDLIPGKYKRLGVFPVGRLDKDTEGLLLLTNDGELAQMLMKPRYHIPKKYVATINKPLEERHQAQIEKGLFIHQIKVKTRPARVKSLDSTRTRLEVLIVEGKNRQIRYTFLNLGYKVTSLKRIAYGPLTLDGIAKSAVRPLKADEVKKLRKLVSVAPEA